MTTTELWAEINKELVEVHKNEAVLAGFLKKIITESKDLTEAIGAILSLRLATPMLSSEVLYKEFIHVLRAHPEIVDCAMLDLQVIVDKDPASANYSVPLLFYKGFHALETYRIAHYCWHNNKKYFALYLQSISSQVFGVDIHPAAKIGKRILIDHATAIVVGETVIIEDNVSLLHSVTLGGTGKVHTNRHPKVRQGALLGAGAIVLGNVNIGKNSKIGAGSVVLDDVPDHSTVAGVPAKIVGEAKEKVPSDDMEHRI